MKIVVFEIEPREVGEFDALKAKHEVVLVEHALDAGNAAQFADADVVSTFIYSTLGSEVLGHFSSLKLIATRSTGYDHIDTGYCSAHGIKISNVPTYGENTVAEHLFALLLAISHRLREAMEWARSGSFTPDGIEGFDLQGKTMGVIGTGNIGRHTIRIARGFGMEVLAFDVKPVPQFAAELGFRYVAMDELLSSSDVITLHVPALPQTNNLIDSDAFARMKQGVVVINTSRGSVIDTRALIQALLSGKVASAGLDVLPDEPLIREEAELISSNFDERLNIRNLIADHVLLNMPNVIVTPHSAFNTREAVQRIVRTTVANIEAFFDGTLQNVVIGRV